MPEDQISVQVLPSLREQFQTGFTGRRKIDKFFLDHAGMPQDAQTGFLRLLYETVSQELRRLKSVMGR